MSRFRKLMVVLGLAGLLTGCSTAGPNQTPPGMTPLSQAPNGELSPADRIKRKAGVKVALLLPLSAKGNAGQVAKALKQAGELALFDQDNPNIVLITKDTKGTADGAREAAEAAIRSGAQIILGPLLASSVRAVAPLAQVARVPIIAFSSDRGVAGGNVYLLSFLAGQDVPRIVSYAISRGKRRFAAFIPDNAYGRIVETAFRRAVTANGGEILAIERYPNNPNGMMEPMKRIAALASSKDDQIPQVDALFLPAGPETLPTLAPLLPYFEIDTKQVQLLGTGVWDYPNIGAQKPLIGGWFPAPDPRGWRDFAQRYAATWGAPPPRIATLSYDAVSLAIALSGRRATQGATFATRRLTRPSGFAGVDGLFRLRPDGTSQRGLAILEVGRFGPQVIDPAPSGFARAQF